MANPHTTPGYNRVPFDETFADKTVWMRNRATDLAVRVAVR